MYMRLVRPLACLVSCGALVALSAGTADAATTPSAKLKSVSSPPKTALAPGATLKTTGRLTNRTRKSAKAKVTLTLRTTKTSKRPITLVAKSTSKIKAGKTVKYTVSVKLPASLGAGSYYLRACARISKGSSDCRFATRKLTVAKKATPAPSPAPLPVPAPGAGPKFDVLAFGGSAAGVAAPPGHREGRRLQGHRQLRRVAVHRRDAQGLPRGRAPR